MQADHLSTPQRVDRGTQRADGIALPVDGDVMHAAQQRTT